MKPERARFRTPLGHLDRGQGQSEGAYTRGLSKCLRQGEYLSK